MPEFTLTRRTALGGAALLLPGRAFAVDLAAPIRALEKQSGARIGVAALDTGSGRGVFNREAERFVMCSTFKLSLAAATLRKADKGHERLDRLVHYGADTPIGVSPATAKNLARGMTVAELCEAAMLYSDNGAANTLLAALGGPAAMTVFWRGIGDETSRLDNNEMALNVPDGMRNTTTPTAMLADMNQLLLGEVLSASSRTLLLGWMHASTTGAGRLRAGLPSGWQWGDKTGTGPSRFGLVNDIGIAAPPGRKPILMVCYTSNGNEKAVATAGKILADAFA
ncbi:MAG TPA: class A beta-lactamase [Rhizomicrobium sp.]